MYSVRDTDYVEFVLQTVISGNKKVKADHVKSALTQYYSLYGENYEKRKAQPAQKGCRVIMFFILLTMQVLAVSLSLILSVFLSLSVKTEPNK